MARLVTPVFSVSAIVRLTPVSKGNTYPDCKAGRDSSTPLLAKRGASKSARTNAALFLAASK
jgi:hypothetical protein